MEELSDRLKASRRFETMMGKTHDELMELGRQPQQQILNKKNSKILGHFKYDSKTQTEKFIYTPRYRLTIFVNKTRSKVQNYFNKNQIKTLIN